MEEENFAKQVLMEAIDVAMKKGCFGVLESTNIVRAISVLKIDTVTNTAEQKEKEE